VVGCGGWSRRRTLYGGDQMKSGADPLLDPRTEAARIRAFFVHPDWARRGIGSGIMRACMDAARAAGFRRLELMATLPGEPLYRRFGFAVEERVETVLPDGVRVPFVRMVRSTEEG
jgi:GNAT superfamily N-acetyltransferase